MSSEPNRATPLGLRISAIAGLLFLHLPLALILLYAFTTEERSFQFPPPGYTTKWFAVAWSERPDIWPPLYLSLEVAAIATVLAIIFGTLAAAALSRARFFGRETISLLFVLPIALPGIITGISLRSAFDIMGIDFSIWTIVLGHATFCIVVVYNNAIARFRRLSGNLIEASMDLGANGFQTFRHVILPQAWRVILPPAFGFFVLFIKDTALASQIGVIELTYAGKVLNNKGFSAALVFGTLLMLYFIVSYPLTRLGARLEARLAAPRTR